MRIHYLDEGETVLVTGTQDVEAARAALLADDDEDLRDYAGYPGRAVAGCIVPAQPTEHVKWWWREGDGGNRVKAVVFG